MSNNYQDPTANTGMNYAETDNTERRFEKLWRTIEYLADLAGFRIQGRFALKDKKSGKVFIPK